MDKKVLLDKLQIKHKELLAILADPHNKKDDIVRWANSVGPILKYVSDQYYINFIDYAHRFTLPLTGYSLEVSINIMRNQVEMAIEELKLAVEVEEGIPDQMYFPENSQLDIQKNIAKVIRQANNSLFIADPYMDEKVVEELTNISASDIRLLTSTPKGLFVQRLAAAKLQLTSQTIEAKKSDQFHDRFYIIDQQQAWALGSSLNQAGKKATLLSKITKEDEKKKIFDDFNNWWKAANPI